MGDFNGVEAAIAGWRSSKALMLRAWLARAEGRVLDSLRFSRLRLEIAERRALEGRPPSLEGTMVERTVVLAAIDADRSIAAGLDLPELPARPEDARERDVLLFLRARIAAAAGDHEAALEATRTLVDEAAGRPRATLSVYLVERAAAAWNAGLADEAIGLLDAAELALSYSSPVIGSQAAATLRGWFRALGRPTADLEPYRLPFERAARANERREAAAYERARSAGLLSPSGF